MLKPKNRTRQPYAQPKKTVKQPIAKPDPISEKSFSTACKNLGIALNATEQSNLIAYLDNLMLWNTRINLVGTLDWKETLNTLIIDSFYLAQFMEKLSLPENSFIWDLGSGAGLPGIPLRILWQKGQYHLVESREKRALFMTNFLLKNPLPETKVHWQRAESFFAKEEQENRKAHCIVSRAFMPYEELLDFIAPHLQEKGIVILMLNAPITAPSPWKEVSTFSYNVVDQKRYFIALTR